MVANYTSPSVTLVAFDAQDVIRTSGFTVEESGVGTDVDWSSIAGIGTISR